MRSKLFFVLAALLVSLSAHIAFADDAEIPCMAHGQEMGLNNDQVLNWKTSTQNQFKSRANVKGPVVKVLPDATGHDHFIIQLGPKPTDVIEVIYNQDFGATPPVQVGEEIQACGDYITSNAPSGGYQASPAGAIVHWVHLSPDPQRHDSGFLVIKGQICGQENP
ncbi:MAG: DUF3465 domain-containing protein [Pseudobdellovibrio sp.]